MTFGPQTLQFVLFRWISSAAGPAILRVPSHILAMRVWSTRNANVEPPSSRPNPGGTLSSRCMLLWRACGSSCNLNERANSPFLCHPRLRHSVKARIPQLEYVAPRLLERINAGRVVVGCSGSLLTAQFEARESALNRRGIAADCLGSREKSRRKSARARKARRGRSRVP